MKHRALLRVVVLCCALGVGGCGLFAESPRPPDEKPRRVTEKASIDEADDTAAPAPARQAEIHYFTVREGGKQVGVCRIRSRYVGHAGRLVRQDVITIERADDPRGVNATGLSVWRELDGRLVQVRWQRRVGLSQTEVFAELKGKTLAGTRTTDGVAQRFALDVPEGTLVCPLIDPWLLRRWKLRPGATREVTVFRSPDVRIEKRRIKNLGPIQVESGGKRLLAWSYSDTGPAGDTTTLVLTPDFRLLRSTAKSATGETEWVRAVPPAAKR